MSLKRGEPWGEPGALGADEPIARSDPELAAAAGAALERGESAEVGLLGGDLHRTFGAPQHSPDDLRCGRGMRLPVDVGHVVGHTPDGDQLSGWFCAHLVAACGPMKMVFSSYTLVVMNASSRGLHDLGPRAHPGDGLLDFTEGRLGLWDRIRAGRRLRTGTHIPHPGLTVYRKAGATVDFEHPMRLHLDGIYHCRVTRVEITCVPDRLVVVV